jgi:hypothetical protein
MKKTDMNNAGMTPAGHDDGNDDALPDQLRQSLRALRHDTIPGSELWPGIASRIAGTTAAPPPRLAGSRHARPPRRLLRFAAAASLAAVLVITWKLVPTPSTDTRVAGLMLHEAKSMTREYQAAWRPLDAQRHPGIDASGLQQLDRSAAEVRAALAQDPDARFLFDRLQSLYARRLDLSRRLASPATSPT